jgi:membrane-bound lytic murein transglycosylase B
MHGLMSRWGRALAIGAASLLVACATESVPPERLTALRTKAQACQEALPDVNRFNVDGSGSVWVIAQGPEAAVIERNFQDCVAARGRWATWTAGQLPPMLEPLGTDNPNPSVPIP